MSQGIEIKDGIPHVWGVPCIKDEEKPFLDCFSQWKCPHCKAHMSKKMICLNACHLTAASYNKFNDLICNIAAEIDKKEKQ